MFVTDAVTGGLPVHIAAKLLGHDNISTTQHYLTLGNCIRWASFGRSLAEDGVRVPALVQCPMRPAVRATLHTREAWAYAKQGRITAFRRATDKAHVALDAGSAEEEPHWTGYFGPAELAGVTGGRLLELAHGQRHMAGEAAEWIEQAVQLRGPGPSALACRWTR